MNRSIRHSLIATFILALLCGPGRLPAQSGEGTMAVLESPDFFPPKGKRLAIQKVVSPRATCEITSQSEQEIVLTVRSNGPGSVGIRVICGHR